MVSPTFGGITFGGSALRVLLSAVPLIEHLCIRAKAHMGKSMKWKRPTSLGRTVEARAANRAIKVAYIVPHDDTELAQKICDAVFFESYTRWSGAYTLMVPATSGGVLAPEYESWLKHYDPDFVYSYVDASPEFVERIDRICCPMTVLEHKEIEQDELAVRWRDYLPRWSRYIQPVPSISTAQSPAIYPMQMIGGRSNEPTLLTQYDTGSLNRFLADNFGVGYSTVTSSHPVPGLFKTLSLVPEDLPLNHSAGTTRCHSILEAFDAITENKAVAIARLAMVHSTGMKRVASSAWGSSFRLFVGDKPMDRINFWNCRMLAGSSSERASALIVGADVLSNSALVTQLGKFLNKSNFMGSGSGPNKVKVHSSSRSAEELEAVVAKIQANTHNSVRLSARHAEHVTPDQQELEHHIQIVVTDHEVLRLTEDDTDIVAAEPAHFVYVPPQRRSLADGQWVVELDIDRHNNLSMYVNVADAWTLPRRRKITRAFTDRLSKPTKYGSLALVPSTSGFPFKSQAVKNPNTYELRLPSDEDFFRHLALDFFQYPVDDRRSTVRPKSYVDMSTSDKGQNLRGVISMFASIHTAYGIMTKWYWRTVLANAKDDRTRRLHFERNRLEEIIPRSQKSLQALTAELRFKNVGETKQYLKAGLTDTLEYLVRANVFYQVAHWRCIYCGHVNARSFDNMKIKNKCEICETVYFAPIDMEWQYELNEFVYRSLHKHAGLPVLWTIGYLHDNLHSGSFWYLPEVDLFDQASGNDKNEIDVLAMIKGEFYAVEVKSTVSTFLRKDGAVDKFVGIVGRLRPDVALLSFEKYSSDPELRDEMKRDLESAATLIRARLGPWVRLEIMVAEDEADYREFTWDFGYHGDRLKDLDSREQKPKS